MARSGGIEKCGGAESQAPTVGGAPSADALTTTAPNRTGRPDTAPTPTVSTLTTAPLRATSTLGRSSARLARARPRSSARRPAATAPPRRPRLSARRPAAAAPPRRPRPGLFPPPPSIGAAAKREGQEARRGNGRRKRGTRRGLGGEPPESAPTALAERGATTSPRKENRSLETVSKSPGGAEIGSEKRIGSRGVEKGTRKTARDEWNMTPRSRGMRDGRARPKTPRRLLLLFLLLRPPALVPPLASLRPSRKSLGWRAGARARRRTG